MLLWIYQSRGHQQQLRPCIKNYALPYDYDTTRPLIAPHLRLGKIQD